MRTYMIFNTKTGEIVHTHLETDGASSTHDDIFVLIDPAHDRNLLEILEVGYISPGESYRVNVETKTLERVEPEKTLGFGSGHVQSFGEVRAPRMVKVVHEKDEQ